METIFVAIACYNEPYITLTLDNCLENSEHPDRIHFGIWCQNDRIKKPDLKKYKNVNCVFAEYSEKLGLGVSRLNSFSFYDNQDYFLQIDGHTLFEKNWDTKIIDNFKILKEKYEKPVISSYLPFWYTKNNDIKNYYSDAKAVWRPMSIDLEYGLKEGYPKLMTKNFDWGQQKYCEHFLVTGHFIFSDPLIMNEVLPDPKIVFDGDEITTSLRLWTRGYRIFTINETIAWHLNKAEDEYYVNKQDFSIIKQSEYELYKKRAQLGRNRTKDILTGNILGYWGSPTLEKLKEYENAVGINFKDFYKAYSDDEIHIGTV